MGLAGGLRGTSPVGSSHAQHIGRALHALVAAVKDVAVKHNGTYAPVAEELLNGANLVASDQEVGCERMTKRVVSRWLRDRGRTNGPFHGTPIVRGLV